MAKESKVNRTRRKVAQEVFLTLLSRQSEKVHEPEVQKWVARVACEAADALVHEFDDRGWQ